MTMRTKIQNDNVSGNQTLLDQDGTTVLKTLVPGDFVFLDSACEDEEPPPETPDYTPLTSAISSFDTAHANDKVPVGGPLEFYSTSSASGGGSGRTFADTTPKNLVRQHGYVTAFEYVPNAFGLDPNNWKFKMFRPSGTDLVQTGQGAVFTNTWPVASPPVKLTHNLATPIACLPGDSAGLWILNGNGVRAILDGSMRYDSGDLSTLPASTESLNYTVDIRPLGPPPFLVMITDSLGCHGTPFYRPAFDGGISGDPTGDLGYKMRELVPTLTYQNMGMGGQGWAYGASRAPTLAAVTPRFGVFLLGVNDRANSWSTIQGHMAAAKAALNSGCTMVVCEIMPDSSASDSEVAIDRGLNDNMEAWCASNGALWVPLREAMGVVRTSTGFFDDLNPIYDANYPGGPPDGLHHNAAGKAKLAELILTAVSASL